MEIHTRTRLMKFTAHWISSFDLHFSFNRSWNSSVIQHPNVLKYQTGQIGRNDLLPAKIFSCLSILLISRIRDASTTRFLLLRGSGRWQDRIPARDCLFLQKTCSPTPSWSQSRQSRFYGELPTCAFATFQLLTLPSSNNIDPPGPDADSSLPRIDSSCPRSSVRPNKTCQIRWPCLWPQRKHLLSS
jgi:hypothetical protein